MKEGIPKSAIDLYVIDRVKSLRTEKGLSQSQLAHLLDISVGFIGHVESPKFPAKYNLSHINKLAVLFNCSPRDFLPFDPLK